MKPCERCGYEAVSGERFCKVCRKALLDEMRESGYLRTPPRIGYTKRGPGHRQAYDGGEISPWQENNIRIMEDQ